MADKFKLQFEVVDEKETILYKYLNPNLVVVTTLSPTSDVLTVYLLDTVTGGIVHRCVCVAWCACVCRCVCALLCMFGRVCTFARGHVYVRARAREGLCVFTYVLHVGGWVWVFSQARALRTCAPFFIRAQ